jgi:phosphoribosylformylglycinamidine synthase
VRAGVIVFPGSNCDRDVAVALARATGTAPAMIWHRETELPALDLIVLPGGFAYGDYLRAGAMAAQSPALREVVARAEAGVAVLGICNGFQVLTECGLLPGALMRNRDLRFLCRYVELAVETADSPFTAAFAPGERVRMPIAHNDGAYYAEVSTLAALESEDRIAFRYAGANGLTDDDDARSRAPNGACRDIAGILSASRTVLGMMPHPERAIEPALGGSDGARLFAGLVERV